jgi:hypothetical protein
MYTGIILFVGLIIAGVIGNISYQRKKAEYISRPLINDVFLIKQNDNKQTIYYYLKIKNIKSDTVELLHSSLQYNGFVTAMIDSDYFIKDDIYMVLKSDLQRYLDAGMIISIERDYDKMSRFMIEK